MYQIENGFWVTNSFRITRYKILFFHLPEFHPLEVVSLLILSMTLWTPMKNDVLASIWSNALKICLIQIILTNCKWVNFNACVHHYIVCAESGAAICTFFLHSTCSKGAACPFRHVQGERSVVCKHWLRGLCKKGDFCEFLHEYDMMKMPECYFYSRFGIYITFLVMSLLSLLRSLANYI